MQLKLFFFLPLLLLCLAACDREESLLITEVELPREVKIVEEEEFFLRHSLASVTAEDTIGTAIYSEEFGWFALSNTRYESYSCTISEDRFSARGRGVGVAGGNTDNTTFNMFGRVPDPTQPFTSYSFWYLTTEADVVRVFTNDHCNEAEVTIEFTNITEERIQGVMYGEVVGFDADGLLPECNDPNIEYRPIDIAFNLPRQYCD
ncbi:MAG: hypothetical protein AAFZ52_12190 [Bacteroidota bacterium]